MHIAVGQVLLLLLIVMRVNLCQQVVKVISDRLLVIQIRLCISDVCYGDCQVPSEVRLWMMTAECCGRLLITVC